MKVYIELLFLDNLVMNLIILYFSGRLANIKTNWFRLAAGAALGGVYACFMFMAQGVLEFIPVRILVSLAMCLAAFFKRKQLKAYVKSVVFLYVTTFVMAGAAFAFLNLAGQDYMIKGGIIIGSAVVRIALCGILSAIILIVIFKRLHSIQLQKGLTYELNIVFSGRQAACRAYLDTGNALKEPLSGLPVIIVEIGVVRDILPEAMQKMLEGLDNGDIKEEAWYSRIRVIPCKGVSSAKGVLFGFKPDRIDMLQKDGQRELLAVIGVTHDVLHETGMYHALLGPQVLA